MAAGETDPKGSACYTLEIRGPPDNAVNLVALFQQQFRQVGAILAVIPVMTAFFIGEAGWVSGERPEARGDRVGLPAVGLAKAGGDGGLAKRARLEAIG